MTGDKATGVEGEVEELVVPTYDDLRPDVGVTKPEMDLEARAVRLSKTMPQPMNAPNKCGRPECASDELFEHHSRYEVLGTFTREGDLRNGGSCWAFKNDDSNINMFLPSGFAKPVEESIQYDDEGELMQHGG